MLRIPSFTFANAVVVLGIFWPAVLREIGHRRGKKQSQSKCSFQRFIFFFRSWNRSHRRLRGVVVMNRKQEEAHVAQKVKFSSSCVARINILREGPKIGGFPGAMARKDAGSAVNRRGFFGVRRS